MTLAEVLQQAARRLPEADDARLEAQLIAAHLLGVSRAWLIAHGDETLAPDRLEWLDQWIARRSRGEPIAYLLGEREFFGRSFQVGPDCLIPRPETEHLVEATLERLTGPAAVLDVGTGSGCIAITLALENPALALTATDISPAALAQARQNARRLGARVEFAPGDLYAPTGPCRFAAIVSNPPYVAEADPHLERGDVRFEPRLALAAGADGLGVLRPLIAQAPAHLAPGGWLLVEHGHEQGPACAALFVAAGFGEVETRCDLAGRERLTLGRIA